MGRCWSRPFLGQSYSFCQSQTFCWQEVHLEKKFTNTHSLEVIHALEITISRNELLYLRVSNKCTWFTAVGFTHQDIIWHCLISTSWLLSQRNEISSSALIASAHRELHDWLLSVARIWPTVVCFVYSDGKPHGDWSKYFYHRDQAQ